METIAIIFLTIVVIYLIFQHRHLTREVDDLYCQVEDLQVTCSDYEDRIKDLEYVRDKARSKRRKNTNRYRKLFKDAISRFVVYCNNGWSVSKTSLTKAQGVSDLLIFEPKGGYCGLFIELKRDKKCYPSAEQKLFLSNATERGYYAVCAKGFEQCKEFIDNYFKETL